MVFILVGPLSAWGAESSSGTPEAPNWQIWYVAAVILVVFGCLMANLGSPDVILMGGMLATGLAGVITPEQMVSGFANPALVTIAALYVVAGAVRETGAIDAVGYAVLGRARTERAALFRMSLSVSSLSAFMNNTPVVAMLTPLLTGWCRRHQVSPSRILLPMSYIAILGGTCTLIGTSTNLVINGMMRDARIAAEGLQDSALTEAFSPLGMFELSYVGVPFVILGVVYLLFMAPRLLPNRMDLLEDLGTSSRQYLINMRVEEGGRLVGKNVEQAGLRHLPGLFLIEVEEENNVLSPVAPTHVFKAGAILTFTGVVSTIVDLEQIPGLVPVADEAYEARASARREKTLCEVVISNISPLIGISIRDAEFRARYNAAVIAVHRGGVRLKGRVGDIELRPGDTLLLQSGSHFIRAHRNNPDFFLTSGLDDSRSIRRDRAYLCLGLLAVLVVLLTVGMNPMKAALLIAAIMLGTGCISSSVARQNIDWQTLISLGASFGLGAALQASGAAALVAESMFGLHEQWGPVVALASVYLLTIILTEIITNNAAAVLMFPIGVATAHQLGADPRPFVMAIIFAASASFITPLGYQTNLMVYGPGGYRYLDYVRLGLPLSILLMATALTIIPQVWPL
ncbi:MAG: anion permease [Candidatus Hydrogenedentes bacterium]|nr:anion permease [Candidatus Hydrogenedentota bacterium]